ncbi:MAG: N-acetylmuramoyl-L-alanine amidase [Ruminococcaceae bacterium]|nr:N-acetylmuramoyl-L-alanine amidase [Oscillospiraceae bacterium]
MNLIERYITKNDCYRNNVNKADSRYTTFQTRGPIGLMLHSVGTPQPSAKIFADGWDVSGKEVAVHAVLQADGTVYQCLPWNFRGWHAGDDANNTHIGVEMTEPSQIRYTGGANFTVSDLAAAKQQAEGTYRTAVELFAMLCRAYSISPDAIISHAEGSRQGIASNHADPEHLWKGLGLGYTMDSFRRAVKAKLEEKPDDTDNEQEEDEAMNKEQIISTLGDQYIRTFDELPEWAKPELREMLDLGLINGGTTADKNPDDINMLLSDLRVAIVAYRAFRMMEEKDRA